MSVITNAPTMIQQRMLRFCCWEAAISGRSHGCGGWRLASSEREPVGVWRKQAAHRVDGPIAPSVFTYASSAFLQLSCVLDSPKISFTAACSHTDANAPLDPTPRQLRAHGSSHSQVLCKQIPQPRPARDVNRTCCAPCSDRRGRRRNNNNAKSPPSSCCATASPSGTARRPRSRAGATSR